ncbi:MAG: hypothetical protein WCD38_07800 [Candidatus Tumulicola sp.]
MEEPADAAIRAHVERITSSELFAAAERLCRFLRFTVECTLTGRTHEVKEYVVGREVFDRGDGYDPRVDPIVRVEARRLRSRLAEYYGGPGRSETMRIEYPKGGYVPLIRIAEPSVGTAARRSQRWLIAIAAAAAVVIAAFVASRKPPDVVVAPIPTTWIEPNDGTLETVDVALAENLDAELANQRGTRVVAWPEIVRSKGLRLMALRDFASGLAANRLLLIIVRDQGNTKLVRVFAVDEPSGRKRLALTYATPALATFAQQSALAARIAIDLGLQKAGSADPERPD